jgi:DNA polymerase III delta prime subunit
MTNVPMNVQMNTNLHENILDRLKCFHSNNKIPNILFHGPTGSGKKTLLFKFINIIYNDDKEKIKNYIMYVNCSQGKGIKFIREELKFFAKTQINSSNGIFKSILLINAEKLSLDAQSAIRRCIEMFSYNTRFFIVVEDKYKLLKPIISRFCEIFVHPTPLHSFHEYHLKNPTKNLWLKKELEKSKEKDSKQLNDLSVKLYDKGYSGLDIIQYVEKHISENEDILFTFHRIKKEIRNEKIIMFIMLNTLFMSLNDNLKNIVVM